MFEYELSPWGWYPDDELDTIDLAPIDGCTCGESDCNDCNR